MPRKKIRLHLTVVTDTDFKEDLFTDMFHGFVGALETLMREKYSATKYSGYITKQELLRGEHTTRDIIEKDSKIYFEI